MFIVSFLDTTRGGDAEVHAWIDANTAALVGGDKTL